MIPTDKRFRNEQEVFVANEISQVLRTAQVTEMSVGSEASQTVRGQLRNEVVIALNPTDAEKAEDAKEEMTFVANEMGKGLGKKKFSKETRIRSHLLEKADTYIKRVHDLDKQQLGRFLTQAKKNQSNSAKEWREQARQSFSEVSHQFSALIKAREDLKKEGADPKVISALEQALESLSSEYKAEIDAGLNVSEIASRFENSTLGDVSKLRYFYRDSVLDYGDVTQTFNKILDKYGVDQLPAALKFLTTALGADISAQNSSLEPQRLRAIMDDLYIVKQLVGIQEQVGVLMETLKTTYMARHLGGTTLMMRLMLELKTKSAPRAEDFFKLCKKINLREPRLVVYGLQEVRRLLRLIPVKAYDQDTGLKHKLMKAAQDAIDMAVVKESQG